MDDRLATGQRYLAVGHDAGADGRMVAAMAMGRRLPLRAMAVEPAAASVDTTDPVADAVEPASDAVVTGDAGVTDAAPVGDVPAGDEPATDEQTALPPADADPAPIEVVDQPGPEPGEDASAPATVETVAPAPDTESVAAAAVLTGEISPVVVETVAMTDLQASAPFAVSDRVSIEWPVAFAADESATAEIATGTVINVDATAVGGEASSPRLRFVTTSVSTLLRNGGAPAPGSHSMPAASSPWSTSGASRRRAGRRPSGSTRWPTTRATSPRC